MEKKKEEKKVVPITPEQSEEINKIVEKFGEYLVKLSQRDSKAYGGIVDKAIYYPDNYNATLNQIRRKYEEGGIAIDFPEDEEGQLRYYISLLDPPKDYYQAYIKEQMEQDLDRLIKTRAK